MKYSFCIVVLFCFLISCGSGNHTAKYQDKIDSLTIGSFIEGMSDLGVEFQLNKDETFIYRRFIYTDVIQDSMPRGSIYIVTGEYNRRRNRIVLNPKAYKEIQDWGESIIETRNGKYYESDSTA